MQPYKPTVTITKEEIQNAIPSRKSTITDEIVDMINASQSEPEFQGESLLQTAVTYEQVLVNNKASIKQYLNAIRFCSYLISCDDSFIEAYKKTFYDTDFVKARATAESGTTLYTELASAASRYRKSKLVVDILTVSQVPLELIFGGLRMKAVGVLADRMFNSKLDRDKISAAKELLVATKGAEEHRVNLNLGMTTEALGVQDTLNAQLAAMAANQRRMLEQGININEVQKIGINVDAIDAEIDNG